MKYIITENQKNMIIEKVIFKMLDNEKYNIIEKGNKIYFVKNIGDEYADIKYDKKTGKCWIYHKLILTFSSMTSSEQIDVKEIIGRYVEDTLQMEVKHTYWQWGIWDLYVEDTLQMEVKHTGWNFMKH
jgi:hypothetical protein